MPTKLSTPGFKPKSTMAKKYKDQINKLAGHVARHPYGMARASEELRHWINGTNRQEPALDISYCRCSLPHYVPGAAGLGGAAVLLDADGQEACAVGLEPAMGVVAVGYVRPGGVGAATAAAAREPSMRAKFIYPMAHTLVKEHGYSWDVAISTARDCWGRFPKERRLLAAADAVDDGSEHEETLDVVPFR
jgi:hypothetical protein